jgi:hypothetical protein
VVNAQGNISAMETTDDHPFYVLRDKQNPYVQTDATHGQSSLLTTPDEAGNWKLSKDLVAGDRIRSLLLTGDGAITSGQHIAKDSLTAQPLKASKHVTVLSAEFTGNYDLTFNLSVADFHTYFVTDQNVLVHNCEKCKGGVCGVNKNSRSYKGETHVYAVRGPDGGVHKIGESAAGTRLRDGASKRAEKQVRALNRKDGPGYTSEIRKTFSDKDSARTYETNLIERFRSMYGQDKLPGNKTNR